MINKPPVYETEAALCAAFLTCVTDAWTVYPETAGWDILLVRKADGVQIGIEAKLKLNARVLNQALETGSWGAATNTGPDIRAVLVPATGNRDLEIVCSYLGIVVIALSHHTRWTGPLEGHGYVPAIWPLLPDDPATRAYGDHWYETGCARRETLPDYVPDVPAGVPSPLQLTDWKIRAIKIGVLIEAHGYVTRADFKHLGIDHRRWIAKDNQWLAIDRDIGGYRAGKHLPDFKAQHPTTYEQIKADMPSWALPDPIHDVTRTTPCPA